ncbi:MAG: 1-acyl-sn-glycerol-3-phosphate acyltransferase [Actinomycetota bacterium]|nr:1-acyl-sn-glycerol-3-phosphate acyltransferase [Actinomycetota bacterium]
MTEQGSAGRTAPAARAPVAAAPVARSGYLYWVAKVVLTPVLAIAFRPKVEGIRQVPRTGPAILACNHVSYLDWMFLPLVVRTRRISFLAKLEYFTRPGVKGRLQKYFFTATGQVPVDRSGTDASSAALRTARRLLEEGRLVGIFPEGTRSRDGRLYRGRTGVARMAAESGVPVIPCATVGVFDVAPPGTRLPRPRRIGVRFGTPMTWPTGRPTTPPELRAWTDELMAEIQRLSGQETAGIDAWGPRS